MSPVDPKAVCNLARIDTSNDWSDLESLGSYSHRLSKERKKQHNIEVIPSTPNCGYLADDEVESLREMDSLVVPSSSESETTTAAIDNTLASFVISVTNLDLEGTQAEEWETTLQDTTASGTDSPRASSTDDNNNKTTVASNIAIPKNNNIKTVNLKNHQPLKPSIRPRVSTFDKENMTVDSSYSQIPLRRSVGHRRVSFNNLPSPKDLEEHLEEEGVEMSYTSTKRKENGGTKQHHKKKHGWSRRRPKVLNVTTAFR